LNESDIDPLAFNTTQWSVVLAAGGEDSEVAETALAELCQHYWYPLFAFVRRGGKTSEDAKDLTQGFFEHILEKGSISRADRNKGRFRSFLLASLKNYVNSEYRKGNAAKRGGGAPIVSIDEELGESKYQIELEESDTPESLYQKAWAKELLDRVHLRLKTQYEKAGNGALCDALETYLTGDDEKVPYADKAEELGMTHSAITSAVHRLRTRYGTLLREVIAETVSDPEEIDEELRFLIASLEG